MASAFEIPGSKLFCSTVNVRCPKCESRKIEVVWHDMVWEETQFRCEDCNHEWIKG